MGVERMRGGGGVWGCCGMMSASACVCVSGCCSGLREGGREVAVCTGGAHDADGWGGGRRGEIKH